MLEISEQHLSPQLKLDLVRGRYEVKERKAVKKLLKADDKVLEIGTGVGYICITAAQIVGAENVISVETNPKLFGDIQKNLAANAIKGVTLHNYAAVAEAAQKETEFAVPKAFHAASIHGDRMPFAKRITVPAMSLDALLEQSKATALICDAEGAEIEFFKNALPDRLRLIILEVHPRQYEEAEIEAIFERLIAMGFDYAIDGTNWPLVCFIRR